MHVAQVKNGRLTLDEPTDLPEGSVVPLEIADDWDDLDDEEPAAEHREIAASIAPLRASALVARMAEKPSLLRHGSVRLVFPRRPR